MIWVRDPPDLKMFGRKLVVEGGKAGRRGARLGIAVVGEDSALDQSIGELVQIAIEFGVDLFEFGPERFVDEPLGDPRHDGGIALAGITIGRNLVAPQKGKK